ncbi:MAG: branched-chain amino acid aminotransferase [Firmicutes bacterium]|nr:branched-chain amino acid aminotransferase [Clostridiales bacterium]MBQ9931839.1 branched-chain amino acid aminotransferase [Bacillota bacterium]
MSKYEFPVTRTATPAAKPDPDNLGFGNYFTDHMFRIDYTEGKGWHDGRIIPYAPIEMDPAAAVLHYGQSVFEGLKAYRAKDGRILLFRPDMNAKRTRNSNKRMSIPDIPEELFVEAVKAAVRADADWVPAKEGTSLYLRPVIFGTEAFLGVRPAKQYTFLVIMSPSGSYYKGGMKPTKIFVENEYARSVQGGTGFAKISGNYAPGLVSQEKAHALGCDQVLWLDGAERKYVEEIGTSNAFFVIDNEVWTASLELGTILPGITRDSAITLLKDWGYDVKEKRFTFQEIYDAWEAGRLKEVFATGTAAVISPVGEFFWEDKHMVIHDGVIGEISQKLFNTMSAIQRGDAEDKFGWTVEVEL